jgi:TATA-binding protein-associated factor Taf7
MERPWCRFRREARARERRRLPQVVDSLKVLDQNRPFREADIAQQLILRSRSQFSPYQITRLSRYDGLVVHMGRT